MNEVLISESVQEELARFSNEEADHFERWFERLMDQPLPREAHRLKVGTSDRPMYSLRVGRHHRLLYSYDRLSNVVTVLRIGRRQEF